MSEIRFGEIPIPLISYVWLIRDRKSPYIDIVKFILKDMEFHYRMAGQSEVSYAINPRELTDQLEEQIKNEKLTNFNVCRTIRAFCYGSKLRLGEDFYVSTTAGGKKNYHIKVNQRTLNLLSTRLL